MDSVLAAQVLRPPWFSFPSLKGSINRPPILMGSPEADAEIKMSQQVSYQGSTPGKTTKIVGKAGQEQGRSLIAWTNFGEEVTL